MESISALLQPAMSSLGTSTVLTLQRQHVSVMIWILPQVGLGRLERRRLVKFPGRPLTVKPCPV
eukprot:9431015-Heterocapsa_arctica.AAC.1